MPTKDDVFEILKNIYDPELMIDIVTLELIRNVEIDGKVINLEITLTSPMCPYGPQLIEEIRCKVRDNIEGIEEANVKVSFDPPWQPSEQLRATLGV